MLNNFNTLHYVLSILKSYKIKNIVASPGTQNSTFNYLAQEDKDFKCYSIVDERSAVYVAIGIFQEIQEPVVITCTGATASRNYISGLTEAYYRNIPIIALTFYNSNSTEFNMSPQYVDRSVTQNDIKALSVTLPEVKTANDVKKILVSINAAISLAKYNNKPVHINCPAAFDYSIKDLPKDIWTTKYYYSDFVQLKSDLKDKKFAIFIGEHKKFNKEDEQAISDFAISWGIPVICDHTSNYNGKNKILIGQYRQIVSDILRPELILDMGGISGIYNKGGVYNKAICWRIDQNYNYNARLNNPVLNLLIGNYKTIFQDLKNTDINCINYYDQIKTKILTIKYPEFPLSITYMAQKLTQNISSNSSIHLAILRSLESLNLFNLNKNIEVSCNVGGFGIDGPLSTTIGQALAKPDKNIFCLVGDLAFFYDMNILGNRHLQKNIRILLENNNEGATMRFDPRLENTWGNKSQKLVSAAGHYKNGAKLWAESCGFKYLSASSKEEFDSQINDFCNKNYNVPVIFEVFTTVENDKLAVNLIKNQQRNIQKIYHIKTIEKIFSVRNEISNNKKYKVIRILGAKIKIRKHKDKI